MDVGDSLQPTASGVLSEERSHSPDLVSLSSTSGSETHSEDLEASQQLSTSQDGSVSDVTGGSSVPSNLVDSGTLIPQRVLAEGDLWADYDTGQREHLPPPQSSLPATLASGEHDVYTGNTGAITSSGQYQLMDKEKLTVSDYESAGLLYARASNARHNMYVLHRDINV